MGKKKTFIDIRNLRKSKAKRQRLQVCALCYRHSPKKGLQFYLVTSRRTQRWIAPKGWPMKKRTNAESALQEAKEEAGVEGKISKKSIGFFSYKKLLENGRTIRLTVQVFPLEVKECLSSFPEKGQRQRRWFKAKKAAKMATPPEFGQLIKEFARQNAEPSK